MNIEISDLTIDQILRKAVKEEIDFLARRMLQAPDVRQFLWCYVLSTMPNRGMAAAGIDNKDLIENLIEHLKTTALAIPSGAAGGGDDSGGEQNQASGGGGGGDESGGEANQASGGGNVGNVFSMKAGDCQKLSAAVIPQNPTDPKNPSDPQNPKEPKDPKDPKTRKKPAAS